MNNQNDLAQQHSLTDEIADVIRERILTGEYGIGEKIKEAQIALELNVSRTPIREAFKSLQDEGLIDYVPNKGCFAKGFTKQDVEDIYEVREVLETLVMRWAVERISDNEIKQLDEQCDLMEFYTKKNDAKKVLELNTSFHNIIYDAARSRFLALVLKTYKDYLDKTRNLIFYEQSYLEGILEEHRHIANTLRNRDEKGAVEAIIAHMEDSKKRAFATWNVPNR